MDATRSTSKVPKAVVPNASGSDASTEERHNRDLCEMAEKQEPKPKNPELEEEGYLDTAKFYGGKVLPQGHHQVNYSPPTR